MRNVFFPGKLYTYCLLCGSASVKKVFGNKNLLIQCRDCQFTFAGLEPSDQEISKYYCYYHAYESLSVLIIKRYNKILDKLEKYRKTNNLLETGCGNGIFLEVARKRNWNVYGTELSDLAIENCKVKNIYVSKSIDEIKGKTEIPFDAIVSMEVIEHLKDPVKEVREYSGILRNGGALYVTTPNFNSVSRRLLGHRWNVIIYPEHLNYFTPRTIESLLQKFDFKKNECISSGISIGRLIYVLKHNKDNLPSNSKDYDYNERDRKLVSTLEGNFVLRTIKNMINSLLSLFHSGDTLKILYEKK